MCPCTGEVIILNCLIKVKYSGYTVIRLVEGRTMLANALLKMEFEVKDGHTLMPWEEAFCLFQVTVF